MEFEHLPLQRYIRSIGSFFRSSKDPKGGQNEGEGREGKTSLHFQLFQIGLQDLMNPIYSIFDVVVVFDILT